MGLMRGVCGFGASWQLSAVSQVILYAYMGEWVSTCSEHCAFDCTHAVVQYHVFDCIHAGVQYHVFDCIHAGVQYHVFDCIHAGVQYEVSKVKSAPVVHFVMTESLKLPKRDADRWGAKVK